MAPKWNRMNKASGEKREEAAKVKSDPHWIRHLNRNQHLITAIFAYPPKGGGFTDKNHDRKILGKVLEMVNADTEELLNRPAYGLSERAASVREAMTLVEDHLRREKSLLRADALDELIGFLARLRIPLETLDNSTGTAEAADLNTALNAVHTAGVELHSNKRYQALLVNLKAVGLGMYQLGIQTELLLGLLGNPTKYRSLLGHTERQDPSISKWTHSMAHDPRRMVHFLTHACLRRQDADRNRPSSSRGDDATIPSLDGEDVGTITPPAPAAAGDLSDIEFGEPAPTHQSTPKPEAPDMAALMAAMSAMLPGMLASLETGKRRHHEHEEDVDEAAKGEKAKKKMKKTPVEDEVVVDDVKHTAEEEGQEDDAEVAEKKDKKTKKEKKSRSEEERQEEDAEAAEKKKKDKKTKKDKK